MSEIVKRLENEILIFDGAMGTLLQEKGVLRPGMCPEKLNLSHPDEIIAIHKLYVEAGAHCIETNTFGAHKPKLAGYGLEDQFKNINESAVKNARKAAGKRAYVVAGIGPYEKMITPLGPLSFEEARDMYREWVEVVANAGADMLLFETFSDLKELKAAIVGAREVCDLPIQVQLTYEGGERTVTGTPPEVAAVTLSAMDVQIIGTNCSSGPKELLPVAEKLVQYSNAFIAIQPNAGLPQLVNGKTIFPASPQEMAACATQFAQRGVHIIGGCCGTTPAHIAAMARAVKGMTPRSPKKEIPFSLASRTKIFDYSDTHTPFVIGERINPTGKKTLQEELREGKTTTIRRFALEQTKNGAHTLDINVGASGVNEKKMMREAVLAVSAVTDLPLVIDSVDFAVIEEGLKEACGKVMINSVNGETKSMERIIPLARKYGAAIIALTTDEEGLAKTVEKRFEIAKRIKERAIKEGVSARDIVVDCLALTISVESDQAGFTLRAIQKIKKELGLLSSLGISNVSFGLPHRDIINASFLSLAVGAGLDMAIINPNKDEIMHVVTSKARTECRDEAIQAFVKDSLDLQYKDIPAPPKKDKSQISAENIEESLREAILYGDKEIILDLVDIALKKGIAPLDINLKILIPAIEEVGKKFEAKEYFLPQIIMSAEAMQKACARLNKEVKAGESLSKGSIIMATVEGDIHDIGKNIVIAVLESHGYTIIDLGRDVKKEIIVKEALAQNISVIGLSALMTTTMVEMEHVIQELNKSGRKIDVIVGGAAVTKDFASKIGASGYARDAIEAVSIVRTLVTKKS